MGMSGLVYILFGISGYFFAYDNTKDNILNNFSSHDPSLLGARLGLLATIFCQIPMIVVPLRSSLIELLTKYCFSSNKEIDNLNAVENDQRYVAIVRVQTNSESYRTNSVSSYSSSNISKYGGILAYSQEILTLFIAVSCLIISELVPGVVVVRCHTKTINKLIF